VNAEHKHIQSKKTKVTCKWDITWNCIFNDVLSLMPYQCLIDFNKARLWIEQLNLQNKTNSLSHKCTYAYPVAPTPWAPGEGGYFLPQFYKWLGTGGTVSRRTANKKLTKLYWPSRKHSPKKLIVLLEPKKVQGYNQKKIFRHFATDRCSPTFAPDQCLPPLQIRSDTTAHATDIVEGQKQTLGVSSLICWFIYDGVNFIIVYYILYTQ